MSLSLFRSRALGAIARRHASSAAKPPVHNDEPDYDLDNYPKLPDVSRQYLPPKHWDDMLLRRNFGDTLHERDELYSMWGPDIPPVEPSIARRHFTVAILGFIGFASFIKFVVDPQPHFIRREYPFTGLQKELGGLEENKARVENETEEE